MGEIVAAALSLHRLLGTTALVLAVANALGRNPLGAAINAAFSLMFFALLHGVGQARNREAP